MHDSFGNIYAGIYYNPRDVTNVKLFRDRMLFLRAAAEHVDDFCSSLFERCVPIINEELGRRAVVPKFNTPEFWTYGRLLSSAAREWAIKFHINTDWVIEDACQVVLVGFSYANQGIELVEAFGTWWRTMVPRKEARTFLLPSWDPMAESKSSYIKRLDVAWKRARDEYILATEVDLVSQRLLKVPARRKGPSTDKHLEWAALHQCAAKSIDELADQYREDTETIRISVTRILRNLSFEPPT